MFRKSSGNVPEIWASYNKYSGNNGPVYYRLNLQNPYTFRKTSGTKIRKSPYIIPNKALLRPLPPAYSHPRVRGDLAKVALAVAEFKDMPSIRGNRSLDNIKLTTLLRHSRQAIYCGGMTMLLAAKPLRARRRMTFYGMCATECRAQIYMDGSAGAPVKGRSLAAPFAGSRQAGVIGD